MSFAVYTVVDRKYFPVALAHFLNVAQEQSVDCHIFVEDLAVQQSWLERTARGLAHDRIHFHLNLLGSSLPADLPFDDKWPRIVYLRVFAPIVLKGYQKLLYVDADVLINGSLEYLINLDLQGKSLAAIHDTGAVGLHAPGLPITRVEWLRSIGIRSLRYFNSGVLLINRDKWVQFDFSKELSRFYSRYSRTARMWDQDFLNHFFQDDWIELSPKWNFQITLFPYGYMRVFDPVIYHFTDGRKPWHWNDFDWDCRFISIYKELAKKGAMTRSDFPTPHYKSPKISLAKSLKIKFRKTLIRFGVSLPASKITRKLETWQKISDIYSEFFEESLQKGLFQDCGAFEFRHDARKAFGPFFNGRIVVDSAQFSEKLNLK